MHNWDFHEAFTPLLDVFCGRQAETKACLFWVCKRSLVQCGDGKCTGMSRRTSGNENKNKAAVYGKRHEGNSSGAAFESRGKNFAGTLWRGCHLPSPLCLCQGTVSGHCCCLHWESLGLLSPWWNPWKCSKKHAGVVLTGMWLNGGLGSLVLMLELDLGCLFQPLISMPLSFWSSLTPWAEFSRLEQSSERPDGITVWDIWWLDFPSVLE